MKRSLNLSFIFLEGFLETRRIANIATFIM